MSSEAKKTSTTGTREQHHRKQQVGRHDRPAQVGLDREIAERRLRQSSGENRDRELLCPSSERRPERRHRDEQRDQDRHAADDPVSELDVGVVVLRRQRMAGFAARPVAAAETELVNRTAAPVATITQSAKSSSAANRRNQTGWSANERARRAADVDSTYTRISSTLGLGIGVPCRRSRRS